MNQLTTIAALPQAGGCMSKLPAEVHHRSEPRGYDNANRVEAAWQYYEQKFAFEMFFVSRPHLCCFGLMSNPTSWGL